MFLIYFTLFSGFILVVFSAVLLLKDKPVRKDNKVLGFLFLLMAVYSFILSLYPIVVQSQSPSFLIYFIPIDYVLLNLLGPVIYFYIKAILDKPIKIHSWRFWVHSFSSIPALSFYLYFHSLPLNQKIDLLLQSFKDGALPFITLDIFFYIQMTLYLFTCYRIIKNQLRISSKISKGGIVVDISWLGTLMIIDLIFMFATAPFCFYFTNVHVSNIIAQLAITIQLIYIFIKSIWQTGVFPGEPVPELKPKEPLLKIADQVVDTYYKTLVSFIQDKKPYLQQDCSIQTVSEQTGIPVHHLSNILNQRFDKNFPDFINEYRINEAKRLLDSEQSEKMTLETIGYECGFGSKSSFNKAFKKFTNHTPSAYRLQSKS